MNNKNIVKLAIAIAALFLVGSASAATNVALNKNVQLNGNSFFTRGWGSGMTVSETTIVDGIFQPQSTQWDQGAVWWDSINVPGAPIPCVDCSIQINLGSEYVIDSLIVQADDNDKYDVYYWDGSTWNIVWNIPAVGGWGMQTRPNPLDNNEAYVLSSPITTNALKIVGNGPDYLYSVSEVQAFGVPKNNSVPEFPTVALPVIAVIGLILLIQSRKGK